MSLLIILLTLALVQIWGSGAPLHKDEWYARLAERLQQLKGLAAIRGGVMFASIFLPALAVSLLLAMVDAIFGGFFLLVVSVPLLLYCMGRGDFNETVANYLKHWYRGDSEGAWQVVEPMLREAGQTGDVENAEQMQEQMFRATAYRAFERLFAVLFWFLVAGIGGALVYRLSAIYRNSHREDGLAQRWLWLLEWLPVRVMGFSFAVVGNFAGCYEAWRRCLGCGQRSTVDVLEEYLEGALGGIHPGACMSEAGGVDGRKYCGAQLEALRSLLSRTLLLWITVIALAVLIGL
ncbi:regulatory signaling modulator protein AmpE [Biformimicrobium ophioploci]|uniref:AmpE protein n=1 Tax=Biformimicrobium ophioploci TaxID=3036711 RepID=A0ABQ6LXQ1_9GAMM|nr:regulatory signaling modulator protein AmpE [Microbulbifer sp. NKW57]GMG86812.1 hypothetical protein MNKW57_11330 [Microbulbifer sp. NKW57]